MKRLLDYTLKPDAEAFILQLQDETGAAIEFIVSAEQLDALAQAADDMLVADEDELAEGPGE
jgi:hypothetical protein